MMDRDLLNLHKKLAPSWEEVQKEQQYNTAALSQYVIKNNWEAKKDFFLENGNNEKILNAYKRIEKYGYPKRCPAMKNIINLIIF